MKILKTMAYSEFMVMGPWPSLEKAPGFGPGDPSMGTEIAGSNPAGPARNKNCFTK